MKFKNAPIAEVVVGAQFEEFVFGSGFIFNFYQKNKNDYPIVREDALLSSVIERMEGPDQHKILNTQNSRKLFFNTNETKLIQLQPDRLLFNWRKTSDDEEYPHFDSVFKEFKKIYDGLVNEDLQQKINQLEMTYVDHFLMEDFKQNDYNPSQVLNIIDLTTFDEVKSIEQNISFPVRNLNSNIHLNIRSATRKNDQKKILRMDTTCRGAPGNKDINNWYEEAHDKLLELFSHITTDKAKTKWGIEK